MKGFLPISSTRLEQATEQKCWNDQAHLDELQPEIVLRTRTGSAARPRKSG